MPEKRNRQAEKTLRSLLDSKRSQGVPTNLYREMIVSGFSDDEIVRAAMAIYAKMMRTMQDLEKKLRRSITTTPG